jgi:dTDP-4-dehydrorhamnose reductase
MSSRFPIMVTGGSGQLGHALSVCLPAAGLECKMVSRPEFDFDQPATIRHAFARIRPALVINAAAYTAVDAAESDQEAAYRANRDGPALLAELCADAGIPLIHISTDYVFDGSKAAPYTETDTPCPTGVYGASKRAGEEAVEASGADAIILRTSWVYAAKGKNFARTMINAGRKVSSLKVVADQRGTPTAAEDLARVITEITLLIRERGFKEQYRGIFHATGAGETTWHGFATAIFEEAVKHGESMPEILPISTADWPTPTRRPADSRLAGDKLQAVFGVSLPPWRGTVGPVVRAMLDHW